MTKTGKHTAGEYFHEFAKGTSRLLGTPWAFVAALAFIAGWALTGPLFGWSNTWQLVINTTTTIVTFLMVFLLQNTQNRDSAAIQIKLDELIKALRGARNSMLGAEDMSDEQIERLHKEFEALSRKRQSRRQRQEQTAPQR